ncbi:probable LRR receptor-like serine/threonine-protein kinase At3g47570 [Impatiens glandulifera]|uniref:probable LRR receptor-like serine/threonine-protein kinase At3g47570 n=1 Tax=Impatiens glandulifera TaxID=253017 RepID=UPI001FB04E21|nr:probable LRR receptor-like serine/threonine-protein kinase At3g47570 [Impatiens glandulifera]
MRMEKHDHLQPMLFRILLIVAFLLQFNNTYQVKALTSSSDKQALLQFKSSLLDPLNTLSGWNSTSFHCSWIGISCSNDTNNHRVSSLSLSGLGLSGTISPHLSNLTSLEILNLSNNSFYGIIPEELSRLSSLKRLILAKNSLIGHIPANLSRCFNLESIRLEYNNLSGIIPPELQSLSRLQALGIKVNNLTGQIPPEIGNLKSLEYLSISDNQLVGNIPRNLSNLGNLVVLELSQNKLVGEIPDTILNMSSLHHLSLAYNSLSGTIPASIIGWSSLRELFLGHNELEGIIPLSLSNASNIERLDLSFNNLQGVIPSMGNLKNLTTLHLVDNNLSSNTELNVEMFNSLTNCTKLEKVWMGSNQLAGELPASVSNLSTTLREFCVDNNLLTGRFPEGLDKLRNLTVLAIQQNSFTNEIPISIGKLSSLYMLSAQGNKFTGQIPDMFENLTELSIFTIGQNQLSGVIPSSVGKCHKLRILGLTGNMLKGNIPSVILKLPGLQQLRVAQNLLTGSLPFEVGSLKQLEIMDVSGNMISGEIPREIGDCLNLQTLNMARNQLVGRIPDNLSKLSLLSSLNLSFNDLEGQIPVGGVFMNIGWNSLQGNTKLCTAIQDSTNKFNVSKCAVIRSSPTKPSALLIIIPVGFTVLAFVLFCFIRQIVLYKRQKKRGHNSSSTPSIKRKHQLISYSKILHATNGFAKENLIGKGGFGEVYKGTFRNSEVSADHSDETLAIKVFDLKISKASKSFSVECEALGVIRHMNLVKVLTSCSSIDHQGNEFKALIMEFMTNGNLDQLLYPEDAEIGTTLSLLQRINIAIDVASAMDYLHNDCSPGIVHCDLKPGNILLDDNMVAHVGDFGLARFLSERENSTIGLKGSIGYIAPEYGVGGVCSTKGDAYSFGILVLEMLTATKPTEELFQEGLTRNKFELACEEGNLHNIVDPRLWIEAEQNGSSSSSSTIISTNISSNNWHARYVECMVMLMRIGLSCAANSPKDRCNMREALTKLKTIRVTFLNEA